VNLDEAVDRLHLQKQLLEYLKAFVLLAAVVHENEARVQCAVVDLSAALDVGLGRREF